MGNACVPQQGPIAKTLFVGDADCTSAGSDCKGLKTHWTSDANNWTRF